MGTNYRTARLETMKENVLNFLAGREILFDSQLLSVLSALLGAEQDSGRWRWWGGEVDYIPSDIKPISPETFVKVLREIEGSLGPFKEETKAKVAEILCGKRTGINVWEDLSGDLKEAISAEKAQTVIRCLRVARLEYLLDSKQAIGLSDKTKLTPENFLLKSM